MAFIETAKQRYTTKKYNSTERISADKIAELKEILRLSPSSINSQPWKFFFISDGETKTKLAEASYWNAEKINEASHLVVFSALNDVQRFEEQINSTLPEGSINYYHRFLKSQGEQHVQSWMKQQVYLSLGFFLAACASNNIDATPMEGIENDRYDQILGLEQYHSLFAVAIGYRNVEDSNQPSITAKSRLNMADIIQAI
ncbi:nitroreductase family protein [Sphingobacterium sp. BIGb0165]|uniref:nitroreductase family protein n=1 Tax=Sphingobacterium sp. BIGb0165 TaxID=2940615 RepID=UPI0021696140|nr:nitroreductase family protein [Sphingobacterium sp. BIGb0165]MCS4224014.1 nitroreductase/dihydropteridine reductase [Sphingobacterium sp. BIGb0165]